MDDPDGLDDGVESVGEMCAMAMELNQLSTNLPDQVIYSELSAVNPKQKVLQTVIMFLDISGFTALCEKFSASSKNGTDKLTKTLNGYLGALVQEIISCGGDIMKYAGDAILIVWVVNGFKEMQPAVVHVLRCAVILQEKYGKWTTDVGVTLRVKLGVAAGETVINFVGNKEFCHYASAGYAVTAVNIAEKFCNSGDIVISPTAWCHICGLNVTAEKLEDNKHYRLISLEDIAEPEESFIVKGIALVRPDDIYYTEEQTENEDDEANQLESLAKTHTIMRNAVTENFSSTMEHALRLYVAAPVLAKLDDMQPLEYLSEMRQMTIVFINLVTSERLYPHQIGLLQQSFDIIYTHMKKNQGCLNKIFMFDKGCTFLVLFGLPGFKHENDCAHALQSAHAISSLLLEVLYVEKLIVFNNGDDVIPLLTLNILMNFILAPETRVSIGVTTGPTFCGVVGHPQRHEYTAIGRKVNMAARLMMHYPGMVTCDTETYHHSKLPKDSFVPCEVKQMKGLLNVGTIRQFMGCYGQPDVKGALKIQEEQYPLIGRDKELDTFLEEVELILKNEEEAAFREMIVFHGDNGIGKTRMLDAITLRAMEMGIKVISTSLSLNDAKMPHKTVKNLMMNLLETSMGESNSMEEMQEQFASLFAENRYIQSHLFLVNDLMDFNLKSKEIISNQGNETRAEMLHQLLCQIVHQVCKNEQLVIFSIDNAQFMDEESWKVVHFMGEDKRSLVVCTLRVLDTDNSEFCQAAQDSLRSNRTLHIALTGIDPSLIASLACQRLDVKEVPLRLCRMLVNKGHGNPFWVDQLLQELNISGRIVLMSDRERRRNREMAAEPMIMHGQVYKPPKPNQDTPTTAQMRNIHRPFEDYMVCLIASGRDLNLPIPDSIKGMIQARIDRMREQDQMVLKCASICGLTFPVDMLEAILPNKYRRNMRSSIKNLVEKDMLTCAKNLETDIFNGQKSNTASNCFCKDKNLPAKVWQGCCELRFLSSNFQETAYDMFLENNRQLLHGNAAKFLEKRAHRCDVCGSGDFQEFYETGLRDSYCAMQDDAMTESMMAAQYCENNPSLNEYEKDSTVADPFAFEAVLKKASDMKDVFDYKSRRGTAILRQQGSVGGGVVVGSSITEVKEEPGQEKKQVTKRCSCREILLNVYPELIRHWRAAGCVEKTVKHLIDGGAACLETCDNDQALQHLREAKRILRAIKTKENPFMGESTVNDDFVPALFDKAKLESLLGQARCAVGDRKAAVPHLLKALTLLGNPEPTRQVKICHQIIEEVRNQWLHHHFPSRYCNIINEKAKKIWFTEQVRCLSLLCQEHIQSKNKKEAFLVALQLLNVAEEADVCQYQMIHAYSTMMQCCRMLNRKSKGLLYEQKAKMKCQMALLSANLDDWIVVSQMYHTSMTLHLTWGNVDEAVASGVQATKILMCMNYPDLCFNIMPEYCHCQILVQNYDSALKLLDELIKDGSVDDIADVCQRAWFYNVCWCLVLEGGICKVKPAKCIEFVTKMKETKEWKRDEASYYYNIVSVCLWLTRKGPGYIRQVESWLNLLTNLSTPPLDDFISCLALCRCIELHILQMVWKLTNKQAASTANILAVIKKSFKELTKASKKVKTIKPRLLHLKAYYFMLQNKNRQASKHLKMCIQQSAAMRNTLEIAWAKHSSRIWFDGIHPNIAQWRDNIEEQTEKPRDPITAFTYPLVLPLVVAHRA